MLEVMHTGIQDLSTYATAAGGGGGGGGWRV
jgi:hypothetical protein